MIDIHTHILPGVDDGVQSIDKAIEILRKAENAGIRKILLTPHILEFPSNEELYTINGRYHSLSRAIQKENVNIVVHLGAEIYITPDLPQMIKAYPDLTINGGNRYALIELPPNEIPTFTMETIYKLILKGIVPILAHPERNMEIQEEPERLSELIGKGVLTQLNTGSLTGRYGKRAQRAAKVLLTHNLVHVMGSDIHELADCPYPLLKGIGLASKRVGRKRAYEMVTTVPERIINSAPIHFPKPKPIRSMIFKSFFS
jgi:protein-tyrosine phosphatase